MGYLSERVSYLRGLVDGLPMNAESPESRTFAEIIDLLDDMADAIEGLDDKHEQLSEEVASIDEDVNDLLDEVFDDEEFGDEEFDEDAFADEEGEDEEEYYDVLTCPNCGADLPVDVEVFDEQDEVTVKCPDCGELVTITACDEADDDNNGCSGDCDNCPGSLDF